MARGSFQEAIGSTHFVVRSVGSAYGIVGAKAAQIQRVLQVPLQSPPNLYEPAQ